MVLAGILGGVGDDDIIDEIDYGFLLVVLVVVLLVVVVLIVVVLVVVLIVVVLVVVLIVVVLVVVLVVVVVCNTHSAKFKIKTQLINFSEFVKFQKRKNYVY